MFGISKNDLDQSLFIPSLDIYIRTLAYTSFNGNFSEMTALREGIAMINEDHNLSIPELKEEI